MVVAKVYINDVVNAPAVRVFEAYLGKSAASDLITKQLDLLIQIKKNKGYTFNNHEMSFLCEQGLAEKVSTSDIQSFASPYKLTPLGNKVYSMYAKMTKGKK